MHTVVDMHAGIKFLFSSTAVSYSKSELMVGFNHAAEELGLMGTNAYSCTIRPYSQFIFNSQLIHYHTRDLRRRLKPVKAEGQVFNNYIECRKIPGQQ